MELNKIKQEIQNLEQQIFQQYLQLNKPKTAYLLPIKPNTIKTRNIQIITEQSYNSTIQSKFISLLNAIESKLPQNLQIVVFYLYRSFSDQFDLWLKGRYTSGQIITYALPGESWHNYGLAIDFVFYHNKLDWDENLPWNLITESAKIIGAKTFTWDKPHCEFQLNEIKQLIPEITRQFAIKIKEHGLNPLFKRKKIPTYFQNIWLKMKSILPHLQISIQQLVNFKKSSHKALEVNFSLVAGGAKNFRNESFN